MGAAKKIQRVSPRGDIGFTVQVRVSVLRVAQLLCTAFEGGVSASWCRVSRYVQAPKADRRMILDGDQTQWLDGKPMPSHQTWKPRYWPAYDGLLCGGSVVLRDIEDESRPPLVLDRAAIARGLQLMAEKSPEHWGDFLDEREDATTGDVFLQYALLGELVYG